MELFNHDTRRLASKLQAARIRMLESHPFYGLMLLNMIFSLDIAAGTAYTDGSRIAFDPEFLDELSDSETDFVLMHEILHAALQHCERDKGFEKEYMDIACDLVVNSNILKACDGDLSAITLGKYGEAMHCLPDGEECCNYSIEELYGIVYKQLTGMAPEDAKDHDNPDGEGQSGKKGKRKGPENFKYSEFTSARQGNKNGKKSPGQTNLIDEPSGGERWDSHENWNEGRTAESRMRQDEWMKRMVDATSLICSSVAFGEKGVGSIPGEVLRAVEALRNPQTDWRTVLDNFIQEEFCDYSFSPPDYRYDGDFFLPAFSEKADAVKNVLFMIDTSGSMTTDEITAAYSEIKGALDQFNGHLEGKLGFFDARVYKPKDFSDLDNLLDICPQGGGGTSFDVIFDYVGKHMADVPPASIIILTDGYERFPEEEAAADIPVLWIINNEKVTPPWGKVARIK